MHRPGAGRHLRRDRVAGVARTFLRGRAALYPSSRKEVRWLFVFLTGGGKEATLTYERPGLLAR